MGGIPVEMLMSALCQIPVLLVLVCIRTYTYTYANTHRDSGVCTETANPSVRASFDADKTRSSVCSYRSSYISHTFVFMRL